MFTTSIAGVSYTNPDGQSRQDLIRALHEGDVLSLVPEPDNAYDANAIKVCVNDGVQIGYLPRAVAAKLAEHGDRPRFARVEAINGGTAEKPTLGVTIAISRRLRADGTVAEEAEPA